MRPSALLAVLLVAAAAGVWAQSCPADDCDANSDCTMLERCDTIECNGTCVGGPSNGIACETEADCGTGGECVYAGAANVCTESPSAELGIGLTVLFFLLLGCCVVLGCIGATGAGAGAGGIIGSEMGSITGTPARKSQVLKLALGASTSRAPLMSTTQRSAGARHEE